MTILEEAPRIKDEEVVPLMHTLELERSSATTNTNTSNTTSSSTSSSSKQHRLPLLQRLKAALQGFTPELLAIALGGCLADHLHIVCVSVSRSPVTVCWCVGAPSTMCVWWWGAPDVALCKMCFKCHSLPAMYEPHLPPPLPAAVYFVQGILKLSSLAVTFFLKDHLKLEPTQVCVCVWPPPSAPCFMAPEVEEVTVCALHLQAGISTCILGVSSSNPLHTGSVQVSLTAHRLPHPPLLPPCPTTPPSNHHCPSPPPLLQANRWRWQRP